ncbi:VOC family protein [Wenxinia saemankumensis]|uniref:Uncharacterized conserved protein PhnB, glyoxalase superfamily n=1 Tax=Wenxinia saemankumensis TaxID=1447782 RepID=A0A1M6CDU5_9RHOB|nr:VOC family protein [Wenxinia saemankumensis]SHI58878.1 Uncharacterized conserved protein PhnB, glyoxalase superfamily [Wenxinia saemankumensis]
MSYKPAGSTDLAPYLVVPDPEAVLAFAEQVLGGERLRAFRGEDGSVLQAEIRLGDTVLMVGGGDGPPAMLHLYMPDQDAAFERAVAAGCDVLQPMMEKGDGDRRGGVRSPDGTQWYLARQV